MAYELRNEARSEIESALDLMKQALAVLDRHGQVMAAISLSTAIEQAGGVPPEPCGHERIFGCFG